MVVYPYQEELHSAFQCRDALQLLCDRGYALEDMLALCNKEIEVLVANMQETAVKQWTQHEGGAK